MTSTRPTYRVASDPPRRAKQLAVRLPVLVLLAWLISNCTALGTAPVVRIGLVAPFEGRQRQVGYDVIYAARLAVREWNELGGASGYRVELVALDDGGDPEQARRMAQSLVVDPLVMAVVGHWQAETTAAARPIYQEAGLALIEADGAAGSDPTSVPGFVAAYQAVAPFQEEPGPWAQPAYDACNRLFEAIQQAIQSSGRPTRPGVASALIGPTAD